MASAADEGKEARLRLVLYMNALPLLPRVLQDCRRLHRHSSFHTGSAKGTQLAEMKSRVMNGRTPGRTGRRLPRHVTAKEKRRRGGRMGGCMKDVDGLEHGVVGWKSHGKSVLQ